MYSVKRIEIGRTSKKHRINRSFKRVFKIKQFTTLVFYICISTFLVLGIKSTLSTFINELDNISAFALGDSGYHLTTQIPSDSTLKSTTRSLDSISYGNEFEMIDPRAYIFDQYFKHYNSPLYGTGKYF